MDLHCPLIRELEDPNTEDVYTRDVRTFLRQQDNLRHQLRELTVEARGLSGLKMLFEHYEQLYEKKEEKKITAVKLHPQ